MRRQQDGRSQGKQQRHQTYSQAGIAQQEVPDLDCPRQHRRVIEVAAIEVPAEIPVVGLFRQDRENRRHGELHGKHGRQQPAPCRNEAVASGKRFLRRWRLAHAYDP